MLRSLTIYFAFACLAPAFGSQPIIIPKKLIIPKDHAVVQLVDESRYVGKLTNTTFILKTAFGELRVPLEKLSLVDLKNGTGRLRLGNSDCISGVVKRQQIEIETKVGKLTIPIAKVSRVWPRSLGIQHADGDWGEEVDGLRIRLLCNKRKVKLGESLDMTMEIKNFGREPKKIEYPRMPPTVSEHKKNRRDHPIWLEITRLSPEQIHITPRMLEQLRELRTAITLKPGRTLKIHLDLGVKDFMRMRQEMSELMGEELTPAGDITDINLSSRWTAAPAGKFSIQGTFQRSRHGPLSTQRKVLKSPAIQLEVTK